MDTTEQWLERVGGQYHGTYLTLVGNLSDRQYEVVAS